MRVAVLGAGLPALIVARALLDRNHEVDVYGRKDAAGVLSRMGPRHLWDSAAFCDIPGWAGKLDFVDVTWLTQAGIATTTQDVMDQMQGYWRKSRGASTGRAPCQGRSKFAVVRDGFEELSKAYRLDSIRPRHSVVSGLDGPSGRFTVTLDNGQKVGTYDVVVTTFQPRGFAAIAPHYCAGMVVPLTQKILYGWSKTPPHPSLENPRRDVLVYNGDERIPWHRASIVGRHLDEMPTWCYEIRIGDGTIAREIGFDDFAMAYTQLSPYEVPRGFDQFTYPSGVVPVGRFAEWDGEAMVNTAFERRIKYLEMIEAGAPGRHYLKCDETKD